MDKVKRRHPNVINYKEASPPREQTKGNVFGFSGKRLALEVGAKSIGCSWLEIQPGRTAFPHHYHCANEEALFVLEGEGELRIGKDVVKVGPGDYAAFPVGPDYAHSLTNTGDKPLRYLCLSTLNPVELVGYPDSNKISATASDDVTNGFLSSKWHSKMISMDQPSLDYFDGEKTEK